MTNTLAEAFAAALHAALEESEEVCERYAALVEAARRFLAADEAWTHSDYDDADDDLLSEELTNARVSLVAVLDLIEREKP